MILSKSKNSLVKKLQRSIKLFDLYGQNVNLFINKKPKFYTTLGGLVSICVIFLIAYIFYGFIFSWLNYEKMTLIPSLISNSVNELLAKNQTFEYNFNYQNYYIYWIITAVLPDGTILRTSNLQKYFNYSITYMSKNYVSEEFLTEPCDNGYIDVFLGLDQETINRNVGKKNMNRICIKNSFKMGFYPDQTISTIRNPGFTFNVFQCVNSSSNNNSCAPQNEIDEMIKIAYIQTSLPNTVYDFKNYKKPQKNIYDYHYTFLDKSLIKTYYNYLTITNLFIDDGLFSEDYKIVSTNFNPNIDYDPNVKQKDNDPLFQLIITLSFNTQNYYLRNQKINEIIGNLGGLINAIFLAGKFFCLTYNSFYMKFKIINATFSYSGSKKTKTNIDVFPKSFSKNIGVKNGSKMTTLIAKKFSYCAAMFPSKEFRAFYKNGAKNLHEYLDISKIIKRLQDLDKLKMILLNEEQRRLFEYLPKPDVVDKNKKFSLASFLRFKDKSKRRSKNFLNSLKSIVADNDPVNRRILEFLDPTRIKRNIEIEGILCIDIFF